SVSEHAAHHPADQSAHESTGIAAAPATTATAPTATAAAAMTAGRMIVGIIAGTGCRGCHDLGEQRLVLELVEIACGGIAARGLPALDHGAGILVELAADLGVKAKAGEAALHVAAQALVQSDLV